MQQLYPIDAAANAIEAAGSRQFTAFANREPMLTEVPPAALHQAFVQMMVLPHQLLPFRQTYVPGGPGAQLRHEVVSTDQTVAGR